VPVIENISRSGIKACQESSFATKFPEREIWKTMTSIRSSQQLGDAIRTARKQLALTQPQLALAAGVGVRFVVELEAGKPTVRLAQVLRVIESLGGEFTLNGLPAAALAVEPKREGHDDGA
jgi:y4mF family transcriptional regulator